MKYLKKIAKSLPDFAQVLNKKSESKVDTYSCEYINNISTGQQVKQYDINFVRLNTDYSREQILEIFGGVEGLNSFIQDVKDGNVITIQNNVPILSCSYLGASIYKNLYLTYHNYNSLRTITFVTSEGDDFNTLYVYKIDDIEIESSRVSQVGCDSYLLYLEDTQGKTTTLVKNLFTDVPQLIEDIKAGKQILFTQYNEEQESVVDGTITPISATSIGDTETFVFITEEGYKIISIKRSSETTLNYNRVRLGVQVIKTSKEEIFIGPKEEAPETATFIIEDDELIPEEKMEIYDDTERMIGYWFGKPLYKKLFIGNIGTVIAGQRTTASFDLKPYNMEYNFISEYWLDLNNQYNDRNSIPFFYDSESRIGWNRDLLYYNTDRTTYSNSKVYIVMKYTKTTD